MQGLLNNPKTILMGVLNVTPDSFSDGGKYFDDVAKSIERAVEMVEQGADIIDVGGESTRPGSESISEMEEIRRVVPVISEIRKKLPNVLISVDTNKAKVAEEALESGASMVNSLGGFTFDRNLAEVIAKYQCFVVLYHIKGDPKTMQKGEIRYADVVEEIKRFFEKQIELGISNGIFKEKFVIDPGIGFGKSLDHNLEIIQRIGEFRNLNLPIAVGVSRKSHLGKLLQQELSLMEAPRELERLEASLAETAVAVLRGTKIVRTHDVRETKKFLAVLDVLKR